MGIVLDLALRFWKPLAGIVIVLAIVLALGAMKRSYDDGKRAEGAKPVQAAFDAYVKAAQERTTAITLAWDAKRIEAEQAGKVADDERAKRMAESQKRLAALPPAVAAVVVPGGVRMLLNDAIDSAAAPPAVASAPIEAAPAVAESPASDRAADTTIGQLAEWGAEVINVCAVYRDRALALVQFYESLRESQGQSGAVGASTPAAP